MAISNQLNQSPPNTDDALAIIGLTASDVHDAFRPALHSAKNRSTFAPPNAAGNDLHDDSVEGLGRMLGRYGWRRGSRPEVSHRLVSPDGKIHLSLSSVMGLDAGNPKARVRTNSAKGAAVRATLGFQAQHTPLALDEFAEDQVETSDFIHLYLLHEITDSGVKLAIARPKNMTGEAGEKGHIDAWVWLRHLPFLSSEDDLSVFMTTDSGSDFAVDVRRKQA